jgi:hypothetical protein
MIIGALISGFGSATNALFRTSDSTKITNTPNDPVITEEKDK